MLSHMPGQAHLQYAYDAQESHAEHYRHHLTTLVAKLKVTLLATTISDWSQKKREIFQRMKRARQWTGGGNV